MAGELNSNCAQQAHGAWLAPDTNTRVNNETWLRELCQYLGEAGGGGVLIEGDDAVLRWGDEVVEIGRLQHRREPARRHRRPGGATPNRFPDGMGWSSPPQKL